MLTMKKYIPRIKGERIQTEEERERQGETDRQREGRKKKAKDSKHYEPSATANRITALSSTD